MTASTCTDSANLRAAVERLRGHNDALEGFAPRLTTPAYVEGYRKGKENKS